jgi:hypothetical protein
MDKYGGPATCIAEINLDIIFLSTYQADGRTYRHAGLGIIPTINVELTIDPYTYQVVSLR